MPNQKISKAKSIKRTKTIVELVIAAVLVLLAVHFIKNALTDSKEVGRTDYETSDIEVSIPEVEPATDPNAIIYSNQTVNTRDKFYGDLILVNNDHQYFQTGDEDLVNINELNNENGVDIFYAIEDTYTISRQAYQPMVDMVTDYYNKYQDDTLTIYGSFRTTEFQQSLYDDDLAQTGEEESTRVAKAGYSEHETGLAFDFSETVNYDYNGEGTQAWINQNCYKYGFIVRYNADKVALTQIQEEPWHFRYVGIPHAYYLTKNNLCLEEYTDLIRQSYPYEGSHLEFTDENGSSYEVYFVASDDAAETTSVPVPSGLKYDISGNNIDGFVVTVYKDQTGAAAAPAATEAPTTTTEAESAELAE